MIVTIAAKNIEGNWEGALVVDGRFSRSFQGKSLSALIAKAQGGILTVEQPEGTEVTVSIGIVQPEVEKSA